MALGLIAGCSEAAGQPDGSESNTSAALPTASAAPPGQVRDAGPDASAKPEKAPKVFPPPLVDEDLYPTTLEEQREALFRRMIQNMRLTDEQMNAVKNIFSHSTGAGQGNPKISEYAMTRRECRAVRESAEIIDEEKPMCGAPYMVPLYDPSAGQSEKDAKICIDRYEFPGIPCEYPVVFATAREAAELCAAVGKRLCDAHEWEGACAGALKPAEDEYFFNLSRGASKKKHNDQREIIWAYGPEKDHSKCATRSRKSKKCGSGGWKSCGSNTYPAGSFPECVSKFGVYDLHGNAAEHMNLPLKPSELMSRGGSGGTEMKGSWFIFSRYEAHIDDCRWRAPDWHGTKLMDYKSHANYHLGFRCCKNIEPQ